MTNSFISICKKDNIDTSEITEDYLIHYYFIYRIIIINDYF